MQTRSILVGKKAAFARLMRQRQMYVTSFFQDVFTFQVQTLSKNILYKPQFDSFLSRN